MTCVNLFESSVLGDVLAHHSPQSQQRIVTGRFTCRRHACASLHACIALITNLCKQEVCWKHRSSRHCEVRLDDSDTVPSYGYHLEACVIGLSLMPISIISSQITPVIGMQPIALVVEPLPTPITARSLMFTNSGRVSNKWCKPSHPSYPIPELGTFYRCAQVLNTIGLQRTSIGYKYMYAPHVG